MEMQMSTDDVLSYLANHKEELRKTFGVTKIGLFGSYARGEQREDSDIDLAVEISKEKKSLSSFFGIKRMIEKDLGKSVDLGIETTLKPIVKEQALKEMIYA
jgi:predicted nucleotidyltransferase